MKALDKNVMFNGREKFSKVTACKCKYGCGCSKYSGANENNEYKKCYNRKTA